DELAQPRPVPLAREDGERVGRVHALDVDLLRVRVVGQHERDVRGAALLPEEEPARVLVVGHRVHRGDVRRPEERDAVRRGRAREREAAAVHEQDARRRLRAQRPHEVRLGAAVRGAVDDRAVEREGEVAQRGAREVRARRPGARGRGRSGGGRVCGGRARRRSACWGGHPSTVGHAARRGATGACAVTDYRGRVPRSPLTLAALATAAVPGLDARSARPVEDPGDYDTAIVTDADGGRWTVRAPRSLQAGAALEAEAELLSSLQHYAESGVLSFAVPRVAGTALLPEAGRAVVGPALEGTPLDVDALRPGPGLAADLGRVIAAVHELPRTIVDDAGLPGYEVEEYRSRRMAELDEAAATGQVPPNLLRRWETALEDVSLWRFQPVVVHGDLGP